MQSLDRVRQSIAAEPLASLRACAQTAARLCRANSCGLSLFERSSLGAPAFRSVMGTGPPADAAPTVGNDLLDNCIARVEPILVVQQAGRASERAMQILLAPIHGGAGEPRGVIWIAAASERAFSGEEARVLHQFAVLAAIALDGAEAASASQKVLFEQDQAGKERTHRLENALQMAANMLGQQGRRTADLKARAAIDTARGRILAIANMHRLAEGHGAVDLLGVARSVCDALVGGNERFRVALVQDEPLVMPSPDASIIVLVINELITNAVKHALPRRRRIAIDVTLKRIDAGWGELCIRDDGSALEPNAAKNGRVGMGLKLVQGLARQLGGSLQCDTSPKAFRVGFPLRAAAGPDCGPQPQR